MDFIKRLQDVAKQGARDRLDAGKRYREEEARREKELLDKVRANFHDGKYDKGLFESVRNGNSSHYMGFNDYIVCREIINLYTKHRGLKAEIEHDYDEEGRSQYGVRLSGW